MKSSTADGLRAVEPRRMAGVGATPGAKPRCASTPNDCEHQSRHPAIAGASLRSSPGHPRDQISRSALASGFKLWASARRLMWGATCFPLACLILLVVASAGTASADDAVDKPAVQPAASAPASEVPAAKPDQQSADVVPLNPQKTVLVDKGRKRLLLKTRVAQREALLEMFLCKAGTKEHETIVALDADAYVVHAGLLAIGAEPGKPVQYEPEYKPPTGQIIDIFVNWTDEQGKPQRRKAQEWIRHVTRRYYVAPLKALPEGFAMPAETELRHDPKRGELIWFGPMNEAERDRHLALSDDKEYQAGIKSFFKDSQSREMDADFVFAGSDFYVDEQGKRHYLAESGNIICVANFSEATLDVAARSTAENSDLMFEPWTERIPPLETEVTVELVPRAEKSKRAEKPE
jgi:hypothetical protein